MQGKKKHHTQEHKCQQEQVTSANLSSWDPRGETSLQHSMYPQTSCGKVQERQTMIILLTLRPTRKIKNKIKKKKKKLPKEDC